MIMAVAALAMTACGNDENGDMDNWNGEIRLSSGVAVLQTRANSNDVPDKQIAAGQEIGIYVSPVAGETVFTGYGNVSAKADGSGNFGTYSTTMYYPQSGNSVNISAYHPYNVETSDEYDFSVAADQSDDANYYASDLLYSTKEEVARSKDAHSLTFAHKLCKITCTLTAGDGVSSVDGATVEIVGVEKAVKFNRTTGDVGAANTSSLGNVILGQYGAIIAPQTVVQDAPLLKVTLSAAAGGGVFYHKKADGDAFAGGNLYAYTITVNATGLTVTSTISPWSNITKNGTAEME